MNINPARPRTAEEIDAGFAKIFAGMLPADLHTPTLRELLEPYRAHIMAKRKQGFSVKQISDALQLEPFSIKVSTVTLQKFLNARSRKRGNKPTQSPAIRPTLPLDTTSAMAGVKPAAPAPIPGAKPSLPLRPQPR